jgi:hypothetical protein
MVSAWPEPLSAKPAGPSAGVCDGKEALASCTSEVNRNWRLMDHKSDASFLSLTPTSDEAHFSLRRSCPSLCNGHKATALEGVDASLVDSGTFHLKVGIWIFVPLRQNVGGSHRCLGALAAAGLAMDARPPRSQAGDRRRNVRSATELARRYLDLSREAERRPGGGRN